MKDERVRDCSEVGRNDERLKVESEDEAEGGGGGGGGRAGEDIEEEGECLGVVSRDCIPLIKLARRELECCSCTGELGLTRMLGTLLAPVSALSLVFLTFSSA